MLPEEVVEDSDSSSTPVTTECEYDWHDADHDGFLGCTTLTDNCPCEALGGYTPGHVLLDGVLITNRFLDCEDGDADITAHVSDVAYNSDRADGKDNDCDGLVDESVKRVFRDRDGDGYGDQTDQQVIWADESIFGYVNATATFDCDDQDPRVNPDAVEEPFDQYDQDCDGTDLCLRDADGDNRGTDEIIKGPISCREFGYARPWWPNTDREALTPDCDDHNPAVKPAISEVLDNGIDDNCDGKLDYFLCGVQLKMLFGATDYVPYRNSLFVDAKKDGASMHIHMLSIPDPADPLHMSVPSQVVLPAGSLWQETPVVGHYGDHLDAGSIYANLPYPPLIGFSVIGKPDEILLSAAYWESARQDYGSGFSPIFYIWDMPMFCDFDQPYTLHCTDHTTTEGGVARIKVSCK